MIDAVCFLFITVCFYILNWIEFNIKIKNTVYNNAILVKIKNINIFAVENSMQIFCIFTQHLRHIFIDCKVSSINNKTSKHASFEPIFKIWI